MRRVIFFFFLRTSSARGGGGGGGRCQTFFFLSFFPCSADHERDWPPCKVVFFGLATNALNVRNNNNNNNLKANPGVRHDTTRYSSSYSRRDATTWRARVERAEATRDVAERPHIWKSGNFQQPKARAIICYNRLPKKDTETDIIELRFP